MLDSKGCSFTTSGGVLRFSKENKKMMRGKKSKRLYRLEESIQIGEVLSDMGPMVLANRMDKESNNCTNIRGASAGIPGESVVVQVIGRCFEMCVEVWLDTSGVTTAGYLARSSEK